jgi:hypothetical protein
VSRPDVPPYFRTSPRLWGDERVREWSDDTKLLWLYLLTSPHRTIESLFPLPVHYIVADLKWTARKVTQHLSILTENRCIAVDSSTDLILIRNALKYQFPENPNQIKGAIRRIKDLPNSLLLQEFQVLVRKYCYRKGVSAEVQGFPEQLDQVLMERLKQPLTKPLTLSPSQAQAQTTTLSPTRLAGDGEPECLLPQVESEEERKEYETRKRFPYLAQTAGFESVGQLRRKDKPKSMVDIL